MFETRQIYFNSGNATYFNNGDMNSNLVFYFEDAIYMPQYVDVYLSVESVVFPISFYIINTNNNKLVIQNSDNSISTYYIDEGNYTSSQMVKYLNNNLLSGVYSVVFSSVTNKLTFTKSNNTNFTILNSSTCLNILGFSKKNHTSSLYTLTSNQVVDLSGNNQLLIEFNNLTTRNLDSKTKRFSNVFLNLPVNVSNGSILIWSNINQYKTLVYNKYFNVFNIRILDEDYNEVDFNGKNWSIVLTLEFDENQQKKETYQALQNIIQQNNDVENNNI